MNDIYKLHMVFPEPASMLDKIRPSGIRKMFQRAAGLEGVISLGIGAPDLQPPKGLLDNIRANLKKRTHSYVLNDGIPALQEKIKSRYSEEYKLHTADSKVIVGAGGTELMYGAFFAYANPGDEVIVPDPGFVYYPTIPLMVGCNVNPIDLDDQFQMNVDRVNEMVSSKTKMIVVNSPGNPTGVVQKDETLKGIAEIAIDNDILILSDEVYEYIVYDGKKHTPIAKYAPDHSITLNSFSKTYCVPGWRLGFSIGNDEVMQPLSKIHAFMVANAPSLPQYAIAEFMGTEEERQFRASLRKTMEKRRDIVMQEYSRLDGINVPDISGSFYAFPKVEHPRFGGDNPGYDFTEYAFEKARVVTVAASEFGESRQDHFRISFGSANLEDIKESARRIGEIL